MTETKKYMRKPFMVEASIAEEDILIYTSEYGPVTAHKGDYIITYRNGMQDVCKAVDFKRSYDEVKKYEVTGNQQREFYRISSANIS